MRTTLDLHQHLIDVFTKIEQMIDNDPFGYRGEFLILVEKAKLLTSDP